MNLLNVSISLLALSVTKAAELFTPSSLECVSFDPIKMDGKYKFNGYLGSVSGEFESVSKPGGKANQGVPDQLGGFKDIALASDFTCVDSGGFFSEDDLACSYNFDMSFCRGVNNQDDDCYQGSFSAFSHGLDNLDIAGGHGDYFGAFGQITVTTSLVQQTAPTYAPVPAPTIDPSCVDSPIGWFDSDGPTYDCAWYAVDTRCEDVGDFYPGVDGKTANQACCVCGGGSTADAGGSTRKLQNYYYDEGYIHGSLEIRVQLCHRKDTNMRGTRDIFPRIKAKDFDEQENVKLVQEGVKVRGEGVVNGTFIDRGYITYENLNFGASGTTKSILLRYSTFNDKGGKMQFRIGDVNGTIVADYADYNSPADSFRTASVMLLEDVSGMQDLTIVAMEDKRFGFDIAWFELSDVVN